MSNDQHRWAWMFYGMPLGAQLPSNQVNNPPEMADAIARHCERMGLGPVGDPTAVLVAPTDGQQHWTNPGRWRDKAEVEAEQAAAQTIDLTPMTQHERDQLRAALDKADAAAADGGGPA